MSQTVARMERDGLLTVEGDRHLALTDAGRSKAVAVMRKHRLAELLLVNASDFTIEDVALIDSPGDALKINEGSDIVIRRVRTEWTRGPHTENGAYGIYPVQTENVLVEGAVAVGASDADSDNVSCLRGTSSGLTRVRDMPVGVSPGALVSVSGMKKWKEMRALG